MMIFAGMFRIHAPEYSAEYIPIVVSVERVFRSANEGWLPISPLLFRFSGGFQSTMELFFAWRSASLDALLLVFWRFDLLPHRRVGCSSHAIMFYCSAVSGVKHGKAWLVYILSSQINSAEKAPHYRLGGLQAQSRQLLVCIYPTLGEEPLLRLAPTVLVASKDMVHGSASVNQSNGEIPPRSRKVHHA